MPRILAVALLFACCPAFAADPTFLRRNAADVSPKPDDLTQGAKDAVYRPLFGAGDPDARHLKSIARYGELTVAPGGASALVSYPAEEQLYFILEGAGAVHGDGASVPVKANDFLYLPPSSRHGVSNTAQLPIRVLVMGFRVPAGAKPAPAKSLMSANTAAVPFQVLPSHGPTTRFQLLIGTTESTRDKLAAASQMVSLFLMDFAPGGTNIPHHHETEEEIYFILRGNGQMVAGGGLDGDEGRHPTRTGDAWFVRLNTTVGYYSASKPGEPNDQVLAVRSTFPFRHTRTQ